jgi:hypothetical protein
MKTLYLDGKARMRVDRDGPALRVRVPRSADRLFPFRRLVRVVVNGAVDWSTGALLACAEANVPITFLSRDGRLRARVDGPHRDKVVLDIDVALEVFLGHPWAERRYLDWVYGQGQHARLQLVRQADRGLWPTEPSILRRLLFERARVHVRAKELRCFDRQVYGLLASQVAHALSAAGLRPDAPHLALKGVIMVRDFAQILCWHLENPKLGVIKRRYQRARRNGRACAELSWAVAVEFHEQYAEAIDQRFRELLTNFHLFLLETVYDYGN